MFTLERISMTLFKSNQSNFNPFMHNVVKWPNILKSCGVNTITTLCMKGLNRIFGNIVSYFDHCNQSEVFNKIFME